jgi:hypothetical protein
MLKSLSCIPLLAGLLLFLPVLQANAGDLVNISSRCHIQGGSKMAIAGFVIDGSGTKKVLLRAFRTALTPDPAFDLKLSLATARLMNL